MTGSTGTSERGRRRRGLLLEATGALLMEEGFAAVTHRAVAARARLPLASTTYYFASRDDLVRAAVRHLADGWLRGAQEAVARLPPRLDRAQLADALLDVGALGPVGGTRGDAASLRSLYERYVEAARQPGLQPVMAAYDARVEALLSEVLARVTAGDDPPSVPAGLVLAVVDGTLVRALAEGSDPAPAAVAALRQLLDGFSPSSPTGP